MIKHLRTATNVPMSMRKNPLLVKKTPNANSELKEHTLNQLDKNDQNLYLFFRPKALHRAAHSYIALVCMQITVLKVTETEVFPAIAKSRSDMFGRFKPVFVPLITPVRKCLHECYIICP